MTWLRLVPRMCEVALCSTVPVWTVMVGPPVPGTGVAVPPSAEAWTDASKMAKPAWVAVPWT
ncbi:hypothetical protein D3C72_1235890 [compost metagenome]